MIPAVAAAIISGVASLGGKAYGDIVSSQNAKKVEDMVNGLKDKNQNWYDRRYNEDATQRADAQRVLQQASKTLRDRNKAAQGRSAVMGTTEEGVAAEKAANNEAYADAVSRVAAAGSARKDLVEQQYLQQNAQLDGQLANMYNSRADNASTAGAQMMSAGGQLVGELLKGKEGE